MRVLFINPEAKNCIDPCSTPLGPLSIATYLEKHNHTVKLYDSVYGKGSFTDLLREYSPDIVGVSVYSGKAAEDAISLSKQVKAAGVTVVWGGFLASALPELTLKTGCVDMISTGEGEFTWLDLLDAIENGKPLSTVKGLVFYDKSGQLIRTPERELIDLSDLPVINFDLMDLNYYFFSYYSVKKAANLYASKGCPGRCTFCYNTFFNQCKHRARPPEHVISEIKYLVNKYGIDGVFFNDDSIFGNKEEAYRLCSMMRQENLNIKWGCFSIIGLLGKEELQYMFDSGCRWILFGIESGSREMQRKIKKCINYDKIEQTYADCAEIGIVARGAFILGFPGETEEELRDTISLALKLKTSQVTFNYYTLVPSSESYEKLLSEGKFKRPESLMEFAENYPFDSIDINFSNIPDKELKVIYSFFFLRRYITKDPAVFKKSNSWSGIALKNVIDTIRKSSINRFHSSVSRVVRVIFNVLIHPRIRKKYGLSFRMARYN